MEGRRTEGLPRDVVPAELDDAVERRGVEAGLLGEHARDGEERLWVEVHAEVEVRRSGRTLAVGREVGALVDRAERDAAVGHLGLDVGDVQRRGERVVELDADVGDVVLVACRLKDCWMD